MSKFKSDFDDMQDEMASLDKTMEIKGLKRKKNKGLIITLIIVLLLILGGIGWYIFLGPNSKNVYETAIKNSFDDIISNLKAMKENDINIDFNTDSVMYTGSLEFTTDEEALKPLTNYAYDFKIGTDVKNDKLEMYLGLKKDGNVAIDGSIYLIENNIYLESSKLFEQILSTVNTSTVEFPRMPVINYDAIIKIAEKLEDSLLQFVAKSKITVTDSELNVSEQMKKVRDHVFVVNNENAKEFLSDLANSFLSDEDLLKELAKLIASDYDKVKGAFEELKNSENVLGEDNLTFHLYTENNSKDIVGFKMLVSEEEVVNGVLVNDNEFVVTMPAAPEFTMTLKEKELNIDYSKDGQELKLTIINSGTNKENIEFYFTDGEDSMNIDLELTSNKTSDTSVEFTSNSDINIKVDGENHNLKMNLNGKIMVGTEKVAEIDNTKVKDIDTLTDEEFLNIYNNLMNVLENEKELYDLIGSISDYFVNLPTNEFSNISF